MKLYDSIIYVFDKMEDHVRGRLARHPFLYTFIGGTGVVLFWRGVWHMADVFEHNSILGAFLFSPLGSVILGVTILLSTGLFVSIFIGDSIIMSGLKHDKKLIEKTLEDLATEKTDVEKMLTVVTEMKNEMVILEHKIRARCENG